MITIVKGTSPTAPDHIVIPDRVERNAPPQEPSHLVMFFTRRGPSDSVAPDLRGNWGALLCPYRWHLVIGNGRPGPYHNPHTQPNGSPSAADGAAFTESDTASLRKPFLEPFHACRNCSPAHIYVQGNTATIQGRILDWSAGDGDRRARCLSATRRDPPPRAKQRSPSLSP
jgi:hypothetical protein